ncbi:MAG: hypothetical protein KDK70_14555 [Myxococcales bacterium]|nr:hypothetical protein [Myxococcales bacterium]
MIRIRPRQLDAMRSDQVTRFAWTVREHVITLHPALRRHPELDDAVAQARADAVLIGWSTEEELAAWAGFLLEHAERPEVRSEARRRLWASSLPPERKLEELRAYARAPSGDEVAP